MRIKTGLLFYRIFSRAYFYLPFLLIFFYQKGYSIVEIEWLLACYGTGLCITNLMFKDLITKINPRSRLVFSEIFKSIGLILLATLNNTAVIVLAQFILGTGYAVGAGQDTLLINSLLDDISSFQKKSNSFMFLSLLVSGIIGGYLYSINNLLPILFTIISSVLSLVSIVFLIPRSKVSECGSFNKKDISTEFSTEDYMWIAHYSVIRGIILSVFTGFLPYYFFTELGIPTEYFVLILAAYTVTGTVASRYFIDLPEGTSLLTLLVALVLFLSSNIILIILGMFFLGFSSGLTRPQTINHLEKNGVVAIGLQWAETLYSVINFIFLVVGGYIYYIYNFRGVLLMSLILLSQYFVIRVFLRRKNVY